MDRRWFQKKEERRVTVRRHSPPLMAALDLAGDVFPGWRTKTETGGL